MSDTEPFLSIPDSLDFEHGDHGAFTADLLSQMSRTVTAFDPCRGGHPGFTHHVLGAEICNRCGRPLDMSRCRHGIAIAFCPLRHDHIRDTVRSPSTLHLFGEAESNGVHIPHGPGPAAWGSP